MKYLHINNFCKYIYFFFARDMRQMHTFGVRTATDFVFSTPSALPRLNTRIVVQLSRVISIACDILIYYFNEQLFSEENFKEQNVRFNFFFYVSFGLCIKTYNHWITIQTVEVKIFLHLSMFYKIRQVLMLMMHVKYY